MMDANALEQTTSVIVGSLPKRDVSTDSNFSVLKWSLFIFKATR